MTERAGMRPYPGKAFAEAVAAEREYQDEKWGGEHHDRRHSWAEWSLVLNREVGEANDALGDMEWRDGDPLYLRSELIQVAAVCAAMIELLDGEGEDA